LDSKEIYWNNVRSPVKCGNCQEKFHIKSYLSRVYWAIQLGGLGLVFIPFIAFSWRGVSGAILSILAIFGIGICIRYSELNYSELKQFTSAIEKRQKIIRKNYYLSGFIVFYRPMDYAGNECNKLIIYT
jgi:hypothetical protein